MSMTDQAGKIAALNKLYNRFAQVARAMGGNASSGESILSLPSAMVATSASEKVPSLHVKMPNGFEVRLAPTNPLSLGNTLSVKAKRTISSSCKNDWMFRFGPNGWQCSAATLAYDEIRACLTPEGPPPA